MHCRSHDNYIAGKDGYLEPVPGSKYASQQTVFDDLGQGVLRNAFEGQRVFIIRCIVGLTVDIIAAYVLCALWHFVPSIDGVELVDHVKSLGFILHQGLSCDLHVSAMLKQCSQRIYLLRMLRSQGLSAHHLSTFLLV